MNKSVVMPKYYKSCSKFGREILEKSNFPEELKKFLDYECKLFISDVLWNDFYLGNAFKYIWRLGQKRGRFFAFGKKTFNDDLSKCLWYLDEWIAGYKTEYPEEMDWIIEIRKVVGEKTKDVQPKTLSQLFNDLIGN